MSINYMNVPSKKHDNQSQLQIYVHAISKIPRLTEQLEKELFAKMAQGDAVARDRILKAHLSLVVVIAHTNEGKGLPLAKLIQEGERGLIQALDLYDGSMTFRFSTLAGFVIKKSIHRAIAYYAGSDDEIQSLETLEDDNYDHNIVFTKLAEELSKLPSPKSPLPPPETQFSKDQQSDYFATLLATIPKDAGYEVFADTLEQSNRMFKHQLAARLLPAIKEEMQSRPHAKYDDKKMLVHWLNTELKRFDLAIKHPKTGLPAAFKPYPGNHPEIGAFQLVSKDADGKEKTFTTPELALLLENLELMEPAPRREALAEWNQRVGRQPRGHKRG